MNRLFLTLFSLASVLSLSLGAFFRDTFALFRGDPAAMFAGAPQLSLTGGPTAHVDSALFNYNRHESNVSRRSAERNI